MNRTLIAAFLICQCCGELVAWLAPHLSGPGGPASWVAGVVLLLPGDIAATWAVERLLWHSSHTLLQLQWIKIAIELLVNAVTWALLAACVASLRRRTSRSTAP